MGLYNTTPEPVSEKSTRRFCSFGKENGEVIVNMHVRPSRKYINRSEWQERTAGNTVLQAMATLEDRAKRLVTTKGGAVFVCGPPGVGKTRAITNACKGILPTVRCDVASTVGLAQALEETSRVRGVAVMDDADPVWQNFDNLQVLRRATDAADRRFVIHGRKSDEEYDFQHCKVFLATNIDLTDTTRFNVRHRPIIAALLDRATLVVIPNDREQLRDYTIKLAVCDGLLQQFSLQISNDALAWFARHVAVLDRVSPRVLVKIAKERHSDPANWERNLAATMRIQTAPTYRGDIPQIVL